MHGQYPQILPDKYSMYQPSAGQISCYAPFEVVGDQCIYVVEEISTSWQEGRDICGSLAGDTGSGDLASFPSCESYTAFTRHLVMQGALSLGDKQPSVQSFIVTHKGTIREW